MCVSWCAAALRLRVSPPHTKHPPTHATQHNTTPRDANAHAAQILKNIKGAVDARVSVAHSATILANALMHAGTSIDTFLRDNLEWLSRATNWAKFSATAGLGVIHRGQLQQGERAARMARAVRAQRACACTCVCVLLGAVPLS
jgi:hypothetical protein